ncbi:MAG: hypothetical protein ABEH35_04630 [Haloarculaceae archaeon]
MQLWQRALVAVVLLLALGGLGVHSAATWDQRWPYPSGEDLGQDYESHIGEETLLFGTVTDTDEDQRRATVRAGVELQVDGFTADVQPGGIVQVYGTIRPDHVIEAENVVVVNPAAGSKIYKYATSLVGAILVLVVFFRSWRIDTDEIALEVRDRG